AYAHSRPPTSPLFPSTTLFRSSTEPRAPVPCSESPPPRPLHAAPPPPPRVHAAARVRAAPSPARAAGDLPHAGRPHFASLPLLRSAEHTPELQSLVELVCPLLR